MLRVELFGKCLVALLWGRPPGLPQSEGLHFLGRLCLPAGWEA